MKYVSINNHRKRNVYHTDKDCAALAQSEKIREATENELRVHELTECEICSGDRMTEFDPSKTCPKCGEEVKSLPWHLPECDA